MPGSTPRYGWNFPVLADSPDGPAQISDLAGDVEATVGGIDDRVKIPLIVRSAVIPAIPSTLTFPSTVVTLSIPDPGWSYMLMFTGMIAAAFGTGGGFDIVPRDGSNTGSNLIGPTSVQPSDGRAGGSVYVPYAILGASATLSGARTVYLTVDRWTGTGNGYSTNGGPGNRLSALIVPA